MFQQNVIVLDDNFPGEKYPYIVNVHTGYRFNAGTTSKAAIQLHGFDTHSRVSSLCEECFLCKKLSVLFKL